MRKKRWMSCMLAIALLLQSILLCTVTGVQALASVQSTEPEQISASARSTEPMQISVSAQPSAEQEQIVAYVAIEGKDARGHAVDINKTPVQLAEGTKADAAVAQVLRDNGYTDGDYDLSDTGYGVNLNALAGMSMEQEGDNWYYWALYINGAYASDSLGNITLHDNDKISYIYTWNNSSTSAQDFMDDSAKNPDAARAKELLAAAKLQQQALADQIYKTMLDGGKTVYGIENPDALYIVFSLIRSGYEAGDYYESTLSKVSSQLRQLAADGKVTVDGTDITEDTILASGNAELIYAKIALFVTAMRKDASNVEGYNLIQQMAKRTVYEGSSSYKAAGCTTLLALDSAGYPLPAGDAYITRSEIVSGIVGQLDSIIADSIKWGVDMTALLLQPLYSYTLEDNPAVKEANAAYDMQEVKKAVKKGLSFLQSMQSETGLYGDSYAPNNAWSLAQVMTTMGQFGISPVSEADGTDFIKNGMTVLDHVSAFIDADAGTVDASLMSYQPEQMLRGLTSAVSAAEKTGTVYSVADSPAQLSEPGTPSAPGTPGEPSTPTTPGEPGTSSTPSGQPGQGSLTVGAQVTDPSSGAVYQITGTSAAKRTAAYCAPTDKKIKKAVIPDKITIDGSTYKVTSVLANAFRGCTRLTTVTIGKNVSSIGKNSFYQCRKLKKITIRCVKLKKIGKNAFKGIDSKAVFQVPKDMKAKYRKLITDKATGYAKTMQIKQ